MSPNRSEVLIRQRRALWIALAANATFMGAEAIGGIVFNSIALLADAAHMLSDVIGLAVALVAQSLATRPASPRHTYGMQRAEVMGALVNGVVLAVAVVWIVIEALRRFGDAQPITGTGVIAVATGGLLVNIGSAVVLSRSRGKSLNMRGAFLHMISDAAGSVAVLIAAGAALAWGVAWADPLASLFIALLILWATTDLLRQTVRVLMEGVPRGLDVEDIERALLDQEPVRSVHHLHVWSVASDVTALSAHVVVDHESLHDAQLEGDRLKRLLRDRFDVDHATLEMECHSCEDEPNR